MLSHLNSCVEYYAGKLNNTTQPMGRSLRSRTRGSCSEIGLAGKVQDNMRHRSGPFRVQLTKTYTNRYVVSILNLCSQRNYSTLKTIGGEGA